MELIIWLANNIEVSQRLEFVKKWTYFSSSSNLLEIWVKIVYIAYPVKHTLLTFYMVQAYLSLYK